MEISENVWDELARMQLEDVDVDWDAGGGL